MSFGQLALITRDIITRVCSCIVTKPQTPRRKPYLLGGVIKVKLMIMTGNPRRANVELYIFTNAIVAFFPEKKLLKSDERIFLSFLNTS